MDIQLLNKKRYYIFFLQCWFCCLMLPGVSQNNFTDSLLSTISLLDSSSQKLDSLLKLSEEYSEFDLTKSVEIAHRGKAMAIDDGLKDYIAKFDFYLGDVYQMMAKYDSAHLFLDAAIAYYENVEKLDLLAKSLMRKSFIFQNQSKFEKTNETLLKALVNFEKANDQSGIANAYVRFSDLFFYQEQYEKGISFGEKAIAIYQSLHDELGLASAYQYTADNYLQLEKYIEALDFMDKALIIKKEQNVHLIELASLINSRGNVLKHMERYKEALAAYNESMKMVKTLNHQGGIVATSANIADVYMRMKKYEEALPLKLLSVKIADENGFMSNQLENVSHLSEIYKNLGDYEKALFYHEKQFAIRDSIFTVEKTQAISELQTKYDTKKKEELIASQKALLKQQKTIQIFAWGIAGLLGIFLFQVYRNFNQKRKNNLLLTSTNTQLEQKNRENELLLKEIHHRVKNNLQVISSLLSFQSRSVKDKGVKSAILDSQSRVRSMSLIHQKLYKGSNLAAIEMKTYFENLTDNLIDAYLDDNKDLEVKLNMSDVEMDVDYAIPLGLIANELLTNSLKYAFNEKQKGIIEINLQKEENDFVLVIKDDGIGQNIVSAPTDDGGFGSELVEMLTQQIKGQLTQTKQDGYCTQIRFPYLKSVA